MCDESNVVYQVLEEKIAERGIKKAVIARGGNYAESAVE